MQRIWDWLLDLKRVKLPEGGEVTVRLTDAWAPWVSLLATVALIAYVVWVYRRDGGTKLCKGLGGALRVILLLLLLLLIWQPVIRIEHTDREPGVVAVLIDASASMDTPDHYLPGDQMIKDALAADGGPTTQPDAASLKEVADRYNGRKRIDLVRQAIDEDNHRVLRRLLANNDLTLFTYDAEAVRRLELHQSARDPKSDQDETLVRDADLPAADEAVAKIDQLKLDAGGLATDLARSAYNVLQDLRGRRLAGLIIIGDGRNTGETDLGAVLELARKFRTPVPIYTFRVGSEEPPRDLAVSAALAAPVVFANDQVAVEATVIQHGYQEEQKVQVHLVDAATGADLAPPEEVTVGRPIQSGDGDASGPPQRESEVKAELRFRPQLPGDYQLAIRVAPEAGDINPDNNQSIVHLEVKDAKVRVLYIDGYPRWEYRYLMHSLKNERSIIVSALLLSADENFAQEGNEPITRLPVDMAEWKERAWDVIIFGDVNPLDLTYQQMVDMEKLVREQSVGFAVIAGDCWTPNAYANTPLARLMPVEIDAGSAAETTATPNRPYKLRLTYEGKHSPILRFEERPEDNEKTIDNFPELYWYYRIKRLKPGAEVLAEHPTDKYGRDNQPVPLLVTGQWGYGSTYFSAIDATWRWRWHTGVGWFDTYWVQVVRQLSRNKLLQRDRRFILRTGRPEYDLNEEVKVVLEVLDKTLAPQLPDKLEIEVTDRNNHQAAGLVLKRVDKNSMQYTGVYQPPAAGNWAFSLTASTIATNFGRAGRDDMSVPRVQISVQMASKETQDRRIDPDSLERLSAMTNGRSGTLADLDRLVTQMPNMGRPIEDNRSVPLWDTRLSLILFALLITAEWILRKRFNLQ
ncbi:MAG: hypothetical protein BIFFINMI_03780 [Phycisphaerae bacterium]|nr:hypothetical protein [Phycisphaerae bacterium]